MCKIESYGDNAVLNSSIPPRRRLAVDPSRGGWDCSNCTEKGKSGLAPTELVQAGGETMTDVLIKICNKVWRTGEWQTSYQSLTVTHIEKGTYNTARTTEQSASSVIRVIMLSIILNRLKPQAGEFIADKQASFKVGRSTTKQIFHLRILCDKIPSTSLESVPRHHRFQKSIWQGMTCSLTVCHAEVQYQYNPVGAIEHPPDKAVNAVQVNGTIGEWSRTIVWVRTGCLLSPTFFVFFFWKRIIWCSRRTWCEG